MIIVPRRPQSSDSSTIHPKYYVQRVIPADHPRIVPLWCVFFPHCNSTSFWLPRDFIYYLLSKNSIWQSEFAAYHESPSICFRCPRGSQLVFQNLTLRDSGWIMRSSAEFRSCLRLKSSLQAFANLSDVLSPLNPPLCCVWVSLLANLLIHQNSALVVCNCCA